MSNFMTVRPVGAELFHTDGQTDMTKPIVIFHKFATQAWNDFMASMFSLASKLDYFKYLTTLFR